MRVQKIFSLIKGYFSERVNLSLHRTVMIPILFVLMGLSGGCHVAPTWHPLDRYCVFRADTGQPEPDVLIAFHDKRLNKVIYAKTNEKGLARLDGISHDGWKSRKEFEVLIGKEGFDPPVACNNPPDVLRLNPKLNDCAFYCIVPHGFERKTIKGHDHRDIFAGSGETQEELRKEWEAYWEKSSVSH